jgi:hypothetical protein
MVDYNTYRELHADAAVFASPSRDDLGDEKMDQNEPPDGPFVLLLPATVEGFAIQDKKWSKALVFYVCLLR